MLFMTASHAAAVLAFVALAEAAPTTTIAAASNVGQPTADVYPPSGSMSLTIAPIHD